MGRPASPLEAIFPEYERPGARGIDTAHFPYVHCGTLGDPGHAEVAGYQVHVTPRGLVATSCRFWQPSATPGLGRGAEIQYVYAVRGPCSPC